MFGRKTQRRLDQLTTAYLDLAQRHLELVYAVDAAVMGVAMATCRTSADMRDMAALVADYTSGADDPDLEAAAAAGRASAVDLLLRVADGIDEGRIKANLLTPAPAGLQ